MVDRVPNLESEHITHYGRIPDAFAGDPNPRAFTVLKSHVFRCYVGVYPSYRRTQFEPSVESGQLVTARFAPTLRFVPSGRIVREEGPAAGSVTICDDVGAFPFFLLIRFAHVFVLFNQCVRAIRYFKVL